jgi:hypothetical protein
LSTAYRAAIIRDEVTFPGSPFAHAAAFLSVPIFSAARERFRYFALDLLLDNVMDIDPTLAPSGAASAEPKRGWMSPAVQDLGSMRQLTLLLQGTNECIPSEDPDCPF